MTHAMLLWVGLEEKVLETVKNCDKKSADKLWDKESLWSKYLPTLLCEWATSSFRPFDAGNESTLLLLFLFFGKRGPIKHYERFSNHCKTTF